MRIFLFLFLNVISISLFGQVNNEVLTKVIADYEQYYEEKEKLEVWPELSEAVFLKEKLFLKKQYGILRQLPQEELSSAERVNVDLLLFLIDDRIFNLDFKSYLFPLNSEGGFVTNVVYSVQSKYLADEEAFDKYVQQLIKLPGYFRKCISWMMKGMSDQKMSPKLVVENCIQVLDEFLDQNPAETFFMNPVKGNDLRTAVVLDLLKDKIIPSYTHLRNFLRKQYLPKAPETIAIAAIQDGKNFYEQRTRYYTTFDISPQDVFDTGQKEVKRIRAEMEEIIKEVGFDGDFAAFLNFLRTDPQFYAKDGESLLKEAAWITKRMEGQLPKLIGKLPRMPLTVTPVPAAIAENYTAGRYSSGSYSDFKPGQYWVNTTKLESRPLYVLPALSLHEGVPGHHTQIMLAKELEGIPEFRKNVYLSAYGEGWGLYAEYLGKEVGIYQTAYERFGALVYEMWRACRLVVDPGMHYMGWTREEAFDFMATNTALSIHEVNTEINRYIGWPGQAISYKMGELKIKELRKKASESLGVKFDLREFHDTILMNGSIPMITLERVVDEWIAKKNAN